MRPEWANPTYPQLSFATTLYFTMIVVGGFNHVFIW